MLELTETDQEVEMTLAANLDFRFVIIIYEDFYTCHSVLMRYTPIGGGGTKLWCGVQIFKFLKALIIESIINNQLNQQ